jgi:4a-hydroxytetrahydrobiopterin dehydratase
MSSAKSTASSDMVEEVHLEPLHAWEGVVHGKELLDLHRTVPDWHIVEHDGIGSLQRVFTFGSFAEALAFTDRVGALAQAEGHHPAILTEWGRVRVSWWTHALKGLHRNDFIMAARTDALYAHRTTSH